MSQIKVGAIILTSNDKKVRYENSKGKMDKISFSNIEGRRVSNIEGSRFQLEGDIDIWFYKCDFEKSSSGIDFELF